MPDGRYAYLPNVIGGSVLRLPLTESKPANHPLVYPLEVRLALFPTFLRLLRGRISRPHGSRCQTAKRCPPARHSRALGAGLPMPEGLSAYSSPPRRAGDAPIVRVVDAAE